MKFESIVLYICFFFHSTSIQALAAFFGEIAHNISYKVPAFKPNDSLPKPTIRHMRVSSIFHPFLPLFNVPPYAFQILLIASVTPTSLVSNSYKPTPTVTVARFRPHQKNFRRPG